MKITTKYASNQPCHVCHTQAFCCSCLSAVLLRKLTNDNVMMANGEDYASGNFIDVNGDSSGNGNNNENGCYNDDDDDDDDGDDNDDDDNTL